jgi:aminoglycoside phosphotransferase (APT) family kinase protein
MVSASDKRRVDPGTPHGFGDDPRSKTLRRRPSGGVLAWAEQSLDARVVMVRALRGGSSSAVHALRVVIGGGTQSVILRSYVVPDVVEEEPDIVEREAAVLGLLDRTPLPTPQLLGADPTGSDAGVPCLLMTRLPGRVIWSPTELEPWLRNLAELLPAIHEMPLGEQDRVPEFRPYIPESWAPPPWMRRPELWDRAVEVFHGPRLDPDRVFVHRDYHPGNVLWRCHRVAGVVDWQAASRGPRSVDVFHCRGNIIDCFGLDVADRFIDIWQTVSGSTYHPWAEVVMLVDALGWRPESRTERSARDLEEALARRLAELGL